MMFKLHRAKVLNLPSPLFVECKLKSLSLTVCPCAKHCTLCTVYVSQTLAVNTNISFKYTLYVYFLDYKLLFFA